MKHVVAELQRRIDREGHQIIPIVFDSWRRNENLYYASSAAATGNNILDLRRIDRRVDGFEYKSVSDFVADVQLMLKNLVQYLGYSYEVLSLSLSLSLASVVSCSLGLVIFCSLPLALSTLY